jgi:hypothetical protein
MPSGASRNEVVPALCLCEPFRETKCYYAVMHPLPRAVGVIVGLVVLVLLTFMFGKQTLMAPDNAGVVIGTERHSYASIPCVIHGDIDREVITNRSEVPEITKPLHLLEFAETSTLAHANELKGQDRKWHPDHRCVKANGFAQITSLGDRLFGRSRWTPTGEWRW